MHDNVTNMFKTASRLLLLAIVVATVGCDRVTKDIAVAHLMDTSSREYFAGILRLEYAENSGGFLSLGAGLPAWMRTVVFTFGTAGVLAILGAFLWRARWNRPSLVGLSLILAGG